MSRGITRRLRRIAAAGAALAALGGVGIATADSASATPKNGVVETGELGLYYLSNFRTPIFDLYYSDANFADDYFPGTYIPANNNTESAWNRDSFTWYVCTEPNFGNCGYISPGAYGNLSSTFSNTVSSAYFS